jgi:hypothetical protein
VVMLESARGVALTVALAGLVPKAVVIVTL